MTPDQQLTNVMTKFTEELVALTSQYFKEETKFTFVVRGPKEADGIVISDDNELQKVIVEIENAMKKQFQVSN